LREPLQNSHKKNKKEKKMRRKHTGQPLDYLFRKLNTFNNETTLQEFNDLHDKASNFKPRSYYEIKDKSNLLQQINDLKEFYYGGGNAIKK
jgi:hypothetical protein